jgi:HlyD family secretion protein
MTLRFYVDGLQLQDIALGQKVEVLVDSGDDGYKELSGKISWISAQAEFTPKTIQTKKDRVNLVYALKAKVPNSDGLLKIGMPAEVNFNK